MNKFQYIYMKTYGNNYLFKNHGETVNKVTNTSLYIHSQISNMNKDLAVWSQSYTHLENSHVILIANQLNVSWVNEALIWYGLN